MRIMSWNVNGIKTLLQYSPWNGLKTYENVLNELGADIICFQETKITKKQVERSMAVLPSFDSFFSSYSRKPEKGYSGTCIFTRRSVTVPSKAEEGISGLLPLDRRPEPTEDELIGGTLSPESIALNMQDVKTIDLEGRTTIVDLGLFVLINVYCPNETNEERLDFKLAFNAMLEARILNLIRLGREVIVLGDLNICRNPIDHCDPVRRMKESSYANFGDHPARKWLNDFVAPGTGVMVDLGRHFYPDRKSMFTHWETRINARETNYGTRIDYILATPGLLKWIKTCEIQPNIIGSDHCPVIAEFHESITNQDDGSIEHLWDKINHPRRTKDETAPPEPPKLAAKFYPDFGAEQRLLSNFFGKKGLSTASSATPTPPPVSSSSATRASQPSNSPNKPTAKLKVASSGGSAAAIAASAPLPSTFVTAEAATSSSQPIVAFPSSATAAPSANEPESRKAPPPPLDSPSIDLTLEHTDEEAELIQTKSSKKNNNDIKKEVGTNKKKKAKSSSPVPVPGSSNGIGKSITKPKGKKGQQTLATFFKPPTPAPDLPRKGAKKLEKGKQRASEEVEEQKRQSENLKRKRIDGDLIVSSEDEDLKDSQENEDDEMSSLKKRASQGIRVSTSAEASSNGRSNGSHKKQKSRDASADESGDSDIQDMMRTSTANANEQASSAWSSIFSPKVAPLCSGHGEPCKQWTVNKPGKNKGRVFWLCQRPVGEGYDKGQSKAEVNPAFRCNYFAWESDIKRTNHVPASSSNGMRKKR